MSMMPLAETEKRQTVIENKVMDIFRLRFSWNKKNWNQENRSKNFLGKPFKLMAAELLYIYFDIEKEFGINIPRDDILNENFCTFDGLVKIIQKQVGTTGSECL